MNPCSRCQSENQEVKSQDGVHWVDCITCGAVGPPAVNRDAAVELWDAKQEKVEHPHITAAVDRVSSVLNDRQSLAEVYYGRPEEQTGKYVSDLALLANQYMAVRELSV